MAHSEKKTEPQSAEVVFGSFGQSEQVFDYHCETHGPYSGRKIKAPGGRVIDAQCAECISTAMAEKAARDQAEARSQDPRRQLERAGIPLRFRTKTLDSFGVHCDGQRKALQICRDYANGFDEVLQQGRCMIMSGGTGSGKTHLSTAIANQVIRDGRSAMFTSVREIVGAVRGTWRKGSDKSEEDVIAAFGRVDLLIIDEVGVQFDTDAERLVIFDVINRRYQDVKPTIVISNLPMDAENAPSIRSTLGDRVIDRLRENGGKLITFSWGSYRSSTVTTGNNP